MRQAKDNYRRQRRILSLGGVILSALMLVIALGTATSLARDYVAERFAEFAVRAALLQVDFKAREYLLEVESEHQRATWAERPAAGADRVDAFFRAHGMLEIRTNNRFSPLIALGDVTKAAPATLTHYLALAEEFSYRVGALSTSKGISLSGYFFSPDGLFVGVTPTPSTPIPTRADGSVDTRKLLEYVHLGDATQFVQAKEGDHPVLWFAPILDPLTSRTVIRAVRVLDNGEQPYLIIASEIPITFLQARMSGQRTDESFMLVTRDGNLLVNSPYSETDVKSIVPSSWLAGSPGVQEFQPDYRFVGPKAVFRASVPGANWVILNSITWRTYVSDRWPALVAILSALALSLAVVWTILFYVRKRVLQPGFERVKRVLESENLNRAMVATSPTGLVLLEPDSGEPLLDNTAARQFASKMGREQDQFYLQLTRLLPSPSSSDTPHQTEMSITLANGEMCQLLINSTRAVYNSKPVLLCNFVDITARKRLEEALTDAKAAADDANRAKSMFLATMSHEIRSPVSAVLGNLELLSKTSLNDAQQGRLRTAITSGNSLLEILNDALDMSKIEAGQMTLEGTPSDLAKLAMEVTTMFEPLAQAKHLELTCVIDPALAKRYTFDRVRMRQILVNLVGNAIKFTREGEVTLELYLENPEEQTRVTIGVVDSGIGMTPEQQSVIFERFTQADNSIARRYGGTGLGLALCRELVHLMDGEIECHSERGVGSTFIVKLRLPIASTTQLDTDIAPIPPEPSARTPHSALRTLVVDDNPVGRELLVDQLCALGYTAHAVESGTQAIAELGRATYDILLTDLNMPEMSGYVLAQYVKNRWPWLPIIAVTAHLTEQEHLQCLVARIDGALLKPASLDRLDAAIRKHFAESRAQERAPLEARRRAFPAQLGEKLAATLKDSIAAIHQAEANGDRRRVAAELHSIKGAFAMVHADNVVQHCSALEQETHLGMEISPQLASLARLCEETIATLG